MFNISNASSFCRKPPKKFHSNSFCYLPAGKRAEALQSSPRVQHSCDELEVGRYPLLILDVYAMPLILSPFLKVQVNNTYGQ